MIHYLWWPISVVIWYSVCAWLSIRSHELGGKWTVLLFLECALCPIWIIVTRISKDLIFDSVLYDLLLTISFTATIVILASETFSFGQKMGLIIAMIGLIVFKVC